MAETQSKWHLSYIYSTEYKSASLSDKIKMIKEHNKMKKL
jgi:hypothetical protein